jgi:hypothetical protein
MSLGSWPPLSYPENRMLRLNGGFGNLDSAISIGLRKRASSTLFAIKRHENANGNLFGPFLCYKRFGREPEAL